MAKQKSRRQRDKKQALIKRDEVLRNAVSAMVGSGRFRSIAAFTLTCISLYAVINALPEPVTKPINKHTARTLGLVLNAFGIQALTAVDIVSEKGLTFKIIPECTPIFTVGLFVSFVAFYPTALQQKVAGLAWGIPALYLGNLARLAATFMVSRHDRSLFEVFHVYLGQVFTIFLVILACILWLRWVNRREAKQGIPMKVAGFLVRFVLISGCVFLVWMKIHYYYIWFLDQFMLFGFSLFNYHVNLARETLVYYETFSIVTFTSLVFAIQPVPWVLKIKGLAAGLGLLFFGHLMHRIDNALIAYFHFSFASPVDLTLLVIGQYLLPMLLLIYLFRQKNEIFIEHRKSV